MTTIIVDTPQAIARSFDIVDELTNWHGLVTSEMVPAAVSLTGSRDGTQRPVKPTGALRLLSASRQIGQIPRRGRLPNPRCEHPFVGQRRYPARYDLRIIRWHLDQHQLVNAQFASTSTSPT